MPQRSAQPAAEEQPKGVQTKGGKGKGKGGRGGKGKSGGGGGEGSARASASTVSSGVKLEDVRVDTLTPGLNPLQCLRQFHMLQILLTILCVTWILQEGGSHLTIFHCAAGQDHLQEPGALEGRVMGRQEGRAGGPSR